ncbi:endo alpha-1,4 polygalactosaminidase [Actinoplanes sp. LDG1-06]|uniref:Endo alpha-1,4 polygalactosaminidase n=1 Tax=Paractinoplanes ovalisporus TaxID=2810368 RepID=A0ABS2AGV8_9ACTN|nr:endo alpha-1,4 polygalactosaminidase [Actinoplanes ovalisporus]MBM2618593.1 endo alpha-1,4 polygalactosaminidase [Actinoplanes ovalisporus]
MASRRTKALVVAATAAAVVAAGIGVAEAGTRRGGGKGRPAPTATTKTAAPTKTTAPAPTRTTAPTKTTAPTPTGTTAPAKTTAPAATPTTTKAAAWAAPPANAGFDYQIGGAYTPPAGVTVVSRDYTAAVAPGLYNICYVNAFQTQSDDAAKQWWETNHPNVLLRDSKGKPVEDPDWDEYLLDYSTAAKRAELTQVVGAWITTCASKGFKGVEPDNLDSFSRSGGRLKKADALAYAASLTSYAHGKGLAVGQKNTADLSTSESRTAGFDFAVAEECGEWDECDAYTSTYGNNVVVIEYTQNGFTKACSGFGSRLSIVLRDVNVTTPGSGSYKFKAC